MAKLRSLFGGVRLVPGVLAIALLPLLPNLTGYFLADDFVLLSWTHGQSVQGALDFFNPDTFWFYRPLVKVYYWTGQSLFGLNPLPFHLISVVLHLANGFLLYKLVARQPKASPGSGLVAATIFMLIPYNAETVSWIAAIGDLLAGLCILSALMLFQLYLEQRKVLYLALSLVVFGLGLLARETTILLPFLLLLSLLLLNRRGPDNQLGGRTKVASITGLICFLVVALVYTTVQSSGQSGSTLGRGGLSFHGLSVDSILLGIMDYVLGLLPGGGLLGGMPLGTERSVVWVEAAIVVCVALLLWRTRVTLALFGLAWMVFTPFLFIFFSGPTDRYFYLPSMGYAIFISSVLVALGRWLVEEVLHLPLNVSKGVIAVMLAGLLVFQTASLLERADRWRMAGRASAGVFDDLQQAVEAPHDYGSFYFVDVPATLNGVPFLGDVVQQAVQVEYDNETLTAYSFSCARLPAPADQPRYSYVFIFEGDGVRQLTSSEECR